MFSKNIDWFENKFFNVVFLLNKIVKHFYLKKSENINLNLKNQIKENKIKMPDKMLIIIFYFWLF
jgi:hypothetical protein